MEDETGPKKISNEDIIKGTHEGLFPARKFFEIPEKKYGVYVFDGSVPNDEILVKQNGGFLKVQLAKIRSADHLSLTFQRAKSDSEIVLRKFLGDNWSEFVDRLDLKYLCTTTETQPDSSPALNQQLRDNLTSIQIEQLIDAMELRGVLHRINDLVAQGMNCMAECIELGLTWQRLHLRDREAEYIAGTKSRKGAKAGGRARKLLTDEQEAEVRATVASATGKKTAAINKLAAQFSVHPRTIRRALKKPGQ